MREVEEGKGGINGDGRREEGERESEYVYPFLFFPFFLSFLIPKWHASHLLTF